MKRLLLLVFVLIAPNGVSLAQIISQYVETNLGTTPKAIEIFNNTGSTIDFSSTNLTIYQGTNGGALSLVSGATVSSGTLAPGSVLVIGTSDVDTYLTDQGLTSVTFVSFGFSFNGDDALEVRLDGVATDRFGTAGVDPGTAWTGSGVSTANQNFALLMTGIGVGDTDGWSDPSLRFTTINTTPATLPAGLEGFGLPPGHSVTITGSAGWRMLSAPITGFTVEDLSDDTAIQGITGGSNASSDATFLYYGSSGAFAEPTDVSTTFGDGLGFITYFYNNTTGGSSALPLTLDVSGTEPSGNVSVTLNRTTSNAKTRDEITELLYYYTLVGNPFASNLSLSGITNDGDGLSENVAIWDNSISDYATMALSSGIVAPWQGFWVSLQTSQTATSITIPTSAKTTSAATATYFAKTNGTLVMGNIRLIHNGIASSPYQIKLLDGASLYVDVEDFSKMQPLSAEYSTVAGRLSSETGLRAIDALPATLTEPLEIGIETLIAGRSGTFTLTWDSFNSFPTGYTVTMKDLADGTVFDLMNDGEVTFSFSAKAANPRAAMNNLIMQSTSPRYMLTITPDKNTSVQEQTLPLSVVLEPNYPNPFNPSTAIGFALPAASDVKLSVFDVTGRLVDVVAAGRFNAGSHKLSWNAAGQASGVYLLRLEAAGQVLSRKMTLMK